MKYKKGSSDLRGFTYTYDASGNITKIVTEGTNVPQAALTKEYTYDALGQLATEVNGSGTTFGYAYDTAGNIRSITRGGTTLKSFGYTNPSWPDLLTSVTANGTTKDVLYEGQSQTSDLPSSGNPVTYYNGRDYHFDWSKGRQLTEAVVGGQTVKYAYDMAGVRSSKQVGDTTYTYTTLSGKVMRQQWGNKSLEFVYDDGNQPFAMIYKHGQTTELYYYVLNAQGDVIALLNSAGALVASYNYGAWGNYSVHGADGKKTTDATFIGHINPLRYRGYYYDRETRLYYLQSRYYDFANCRFINADTFATTDANGFLSANMFAYCENNPVNNIDVAGSISELAFMAIRAGIGAFCAGFSAYATGASTLDIIIAAGTGAFTAVSKSNLAVTIVSAINALKTAVDVYGDTNNVGNAALAAAISFGASFVSGSAVGKIAGSKLSDLTGLLFDGSIGFGATLFSDGMAAALGSSIYKKEPKKTSTKSTNSTSGGVDRRARVSRNHQGMRYVSNAHGGYWAYV